MPAPQSESATPPPRPLPDGLRLRRPSTRGVGFLHRLAGFGFGVTVGHVVGGLGGHGLLYCFVGHGIVGFSGYGLDVFGRTVSSTPSPPRTAFCFFGLSGFGGGGGNSAANDR